MWNWLPTRVCLDLQICPLVDTPPGKVLLKTHSQRGPTFSEAMSDLRVVLWNVWNEECALCKNTPNAANSNVTNSPDKVKPVLYPRAKAQEQNLQFVLNRKTKQKILGQPSERPVKVTLVPFSYVSSPGNAAKSISPAPRPTHYFHWLQKALTAWLWYRCFFKGFTYWNPGPWHSDAEVTELTGSVLEEDCPRTLSSFSWDCTWPFSLTSANLISLLPAHSDAIHFQSSPEPCWCGTTCFTSRTMRLINLFPV